MKTIAMYLPQFHTTPENDAWWGKGFTEWTTVNGADVFFEGHNQPRIPLENNYYSLLEKKTMQWQADLAKKYAVGGFCFYHYWFGNDKKILEKPAENLLQWTDIDMPFCFCWANESWARTWSNLTSKNAWANKYEMNYDKESQSDGILLEQCYGDESEWKKHFEYLHSFFIDKRYIKIDNKPVFVIYKPNQITKLEAMLSKWNIWAKEVGLDGIYIIAANALSQRWDNVQAYLVHQPLDALTRVAGITKYRETEKFNQYSYDKIWNVILNHQYSTDYKMYIGGFVDYDDTPRHGVRGSIMSGGNPRKFQEYFDELVCKNIKMGNELVFLNAWNEWGEGMYLEPDTINQYAYLEAVKQVMKKYSDTTAITLNEKGKKAENQEKVIEYYQDCLDSCESKYQKMKCFYELLNQWMYQKEAGISSADYFVKKGYKKIAIYGMSHLGKHLVEELKKSSIEVAYIIDKRSNLTCEDIKEKTLDCELDEVDAIVVTPIMEYEMIAEILRKRLKATIISLEDVVNFNSRE